jgi:redox-sensitive bicupin YhaK (pirin superfamily)
MDDLVLAVGPLGFPWPTVDPFLFCVHHDDAYPEGNEKMGPKASLAGRRIGMDFEGKDGWRMYHGDVVPGFPQHPHRGFETVTLARCGYIDHSDSLGATARFGQGDVQWMTAGRGVVHSEMFPLVKKDADNPLELFQIWLNLPARDKMVEPHFTMLWADTIPHHRITDENGAVTEITVVAGSYFSVSPPTPPPKSWASEADNDVAIWPIVMEPGARVVLPAAKAGSMRTLYFFRGDRVKIGERALSEHASVQVVADAELPIEAGDDTTELLLLQGQPIAEPVAHYGPFVMNEQAEIEQAIRDYRRTQYGGWPWPSDGPVHPRTEKRFAKHADGRTERRETGKSD